MDGRQARRLGALKAKAGPVPGRAGSGVAPALAAAAALALLSRGASSACSSFADFSAGSAWFGTNFDCHPESEMLFKIETNTVGARVFTMSLVTGDGPVRAAAGMTADGRFSALHAIDAPWTGPSPDSGNAFIFWPFLALLLRGADMDDIRDLVANDTFVQCEDTPLHVIVADASGDAMVIEVGESGNEVLERTTEPCIVMTEFPRCSWRNASPSELDGCGADSSRMVLEALLEVGGVTDPKQGMAVLEAARSTRADRPTRASVLFDARGGAVYIAPLGRYDTIWRVEIESGMMTLERGCCGRTRMILDSSEVRLSDLMPGV